MKAMETKPKYEYNLDKVKGCLVGGAAGDAAVAAAVASAERPARVSRPHQ